MYRENKKNENKHTRERRLKLHFSESAWESQTCFEWNTNVCGNKTERLLTRKSCFKDRSSCFYFVWSFNSSPPGQIDHHFADDIFRCIFVNEKCCIVIEISLKFVPKGPFDNNPVLIYIKAWRRIGDKPLSEPMLTRFPNAYMRH